MADAIAKRCAFAHAAPRAVASGLEAAAEAAATVAAALGAYTFAANNHFAEECTTPSGAVMRVLRRDAVAVAPGPRATDFGGGTALTRSLEAI